MTEPSIITAEATAEPRTPERFTIERLDDNSSGVWHVVGGPIAAGYDREALEQFLTDTSEPGRYRVVHQTRYRSLEEFDVAAERVWKVTRVEFEES